MARGRFISKGISLDEKVDALSDDTCRLLFTWLITHLDCEGRMYGDAQTVKSTVFPRRKDSTRKIEKYLMELESHGLISRYSVNGNQYLCMKNFEKHQVGLRKTQEAQSQIPPFTTDLQRSENVITPSQVKVKDKTKVKVKDKEETKQEESLVPFLPSEQIEEIKEIRTQKVQEVIELYQENILGGGTIPEDVEGEVTSACNRYSTFWVSAAIEEACAQGHPDWGYIIGILKNWSRFGKKAG
jgi:hypothetical protein